MLYYNGVMDQCAMLVNHCATLPYCFRIDVRSYVVMLVY